MEELLEYYWLVITKAKEIYEHLKNAAITCDIDDLIQEGALGLTQAWIRAKRGNFQTYAEIRIKGAIIDYIRRETPLPQEQWEKVKELEEAKEKLAHLFGREPNREEIAQALGITEEKVMKREALRVIFVSLDEKGPEEEEIWEIPFMVTPETIAIKGELITALGQCLDTLPIEKSSIIIWRFLDEFTLEEVGRIMGIGKDAVWNREKKALSELKMCLESKGYSIADLE